MVCPHCGKPVDVKSPAMPHEIRAAIEALPEEEHAQLRPWLLAHYDARGYENPPMR